MPWGDSCRIFNTVGPVKNNRPAVNGTAGSFLGRFSPGNCPFGAVLCMFPGLFYLSKVRYFDDNCCRLVENCLPRFARIGMDKKVTKAKGLNRK